MCDGSLFHSVGIPFDNDVASPLQTILCVAGTERRGGESWILGLID
jgi:hypothetical protein